MVPAASGPDKRARLARLSLEITRVILRRPPYGPSTPPPPLADPRVFVPEVVYCGGGTTRLRIRGGEAHDVETRR